MIPAIPVQRRQRPDLDRLSGVTHQHRAPERELRIQAVALACGGDAAPDLHPFLDTLGCWEPSLPVHLLTDAATAAALTEGQRRRLASVGILTDEELVECGRSECAEHPGGGWNKNWIGAKIEALRRAMELEPGKGVLLCDSDLIFDGPITGHSWSHCSAVLSLHRGPGSIPTRIFKDSGEYNAGLVLTDQPDFVDRWQAMWRSGEGGFYEQGALEILAMEFTVDTFPATWNWGQWRGGEDLTATGRRPAVLHIHINGPERRRSKSESAVAHAHAAWTRARASYRAKKKVAYIHFPKTAGSTMVHHLRHAASERGHQIWDSYMRPVDWRPRELSAILDRTMPGYRHGGQGKQIVHNHAFSWSSRTIGLAKKHHWTTCALYRPVRDRLVSYYRWAKIRRAETGIMQGGASMEGDLDRFMKIFVTDPAHHFEWELPSWARRIEHWYPATDEGMAALMSEMFAIDDAPARRVNASGSEGWDAAVMSGEIADDAVALVDAHPGIQAWDAFISQLESATKNKELSIPSTPNS